MKRFCIQPMPDGSLCRAAPGKDSTLCYFHDPETADEAAKGRILGGQRRKRESLLGAAYDLETVNTLEGQQRLTDIVVFDTLHLDNEIARSRTLLQAVDVARRNSEQQAFEERVAQLEALVLVQRPPTLDHGLSILRRKARKPR